MKERICTHCGETLYLADGDETLTDEETPLEHYRRTGHTWTTPNARVCEDCGNVWLYSGDADLPTCSHCKGKRTRPLDDTADAEEIVTDGGHPVDRPAETCAACHQPVAREDRREVDGEIYHHQCAPDQLIADGGDVDHRLTAPAYLVLAVLAGEARTTDALTSEVSHHPAHSDVGTDVIRNVCHELAFFELVRENTDGKWVITAAGRGVERRDRQWRQHHAATRTERKQQSSPAERQRPADMPFDKNLLTGGDE